MNEFWNQIVFDNPLKKYLFVLIAIVLGILLKRIISRYIAGLLFRAAAALDIGIDKNSFVKLLLDPLEIFLIAFIAIVGMDKLRFPSALEFEIFEVSFKSIVHGLAKTILIVVFIWLLLRTIDFISLLLKEKARLSGGIKDHQLVVFFRDFLKVVVAIIGVLMVLGMAFGFEVSKLWTGLGIAGAALALSTKESIENLIASFIIFFDKPFMAGDVVKVNLISGTVEKIGLRSTRIRTDLKTYVTVPNKQMVDSIVDNLTLRTYRKAEIRLQIDSSTPAEAIHSFIEDSRKLLTDKSFISDATVFFMDISGTSFQINIDYFTTPIPLVEFNEIRQKLNLEILNLMENRKILIAGSGMTVKLEKMKE
ncbi:MAG TPA: mechanosensitive ion channel protein MscS [Chitinophagaceae bacterium]|jgi:MscS family membrane protein|nr:mechanosensitive ion channel protein MscS [Chitinophagaceae bacterium]